MGPPADDYISTLPKKRMGAAVALFDGTGRMLLVEPTYKSYWELPGGAVEADESPATAARRELSEELGLEVKLGRLLVMDWVPPGPNLTEGLMVVFDGGIIGPAETAKIQLPPEELRSWAWCTQAEARTRLSDLLARRATAVARARAEGNTLTLENGYPIS